MRRIIFVAAGLLALTGSPLSIAYAQGGGQGAGQRSGSPAGDVDRDRDMERDLDRLKDKDQDRDKDMDRDRDMDKDQDRDRLYLGAQDRFRDHDRDRDGKMTRAEFDDWHGAAFDAMDADGNGLTLQEYQAARLGPGPKAGMNTSRQQEMLSRAQDRKAIRFRLMDGDGDGVVTRTEYMKFGELNYLDADENDDGALSLKEFQQFHHNM